MLKQLVIDLLFLLEYLTLALASAAEVSSKK